MVAVGLAVWLAAVVWPGDQWWLIGFAGLLVAWSVFHLLTVPARRRT